MAMRRAISVATEIICRDGRQASIKGVMPVFTRLGGDGKIYAKMPFIGGQEVYGKDEVSLERAIKAAFTCFCIISEKHGLGLETELNQLGWAI